MVLSDHSITGHKSERSGNVLTGAMAAPTIT